MPTKLICFVTSSLTATALAFAQPPQLQVMSADLDPNTRQVNVRLFNPTNKVVVGYGIQIKGFDAAGTLVEDWGVSWDYLADGPPNPSINLYIGAGQMGGAWTGVSGAVLSIRVVVSGVVYSDRTTEGNAFTIFDSRARQAHSARQALMLLSTSPTTADSTRTTIQSLLNLEAPVVNGALANKLGLARIPDKTHPLDSASVFAKSQWNDLKAELSEKAAFFDSQAEEAKQ